MSETPDSAPRGAGSGVIASVARLARGLLPLLLLGALLLADLFVCPARALFGVPCPGCGLTRATEALLTLDLAAAHRYHPLVLVLLPMVGWMLLRTGLVSAGVLARDSFDPLDRLPRWFWWVFLALFVGLWVVRLAGGLGGHPDGVHIESGILARAFAWVLG